VDRVEDVAHLSLPCDSVPTAICVDTLEHVFEVERAVRELCRVLAPGGVLLVAVPFDFRIHHYPDDYWRLTPSCLARLLQPLDATLVGWQGMESRPHTVLGLGFKAPLAPELAPRLQRLMEAYQAWLLRAAEARPWFEKARWYLLGWLRGKGERRRWREEYNVRFAVQLPAEHAAGNIRLPPRGQRSVMGRLA
jgi:SAM-dependent methyltransferase